MIDKYFVYKSRTIPLEYRGFTPDQSVVSRRYVPRSLTDLRVIFPPWNGARQVERLMLANSQESNPSLLFYDLHPGMLQPDMEITVESFHYVQDSIAQELNDFLEDSTFENIEFVGISLGTLAMGMVASKVPSLTGGVYVMGADNLANSVWHGARTQAIRDRFIADGVTFEQLDSSWSDLSLSVRADAFRDKPVSFHYSQSDTVIPSAYQRALIDALQENGADVSVHTTRLGHYAGIAKFCLKSSGR